MSLPSDFCIFILSHGRPGNVRTLSTLRKCGYTGPIRIIVDNEDKTQGEYVGRYGPNVVVFDKARVVAETDDADNFDDKRSVIYARNACWGIARELGYNYFLQLDDDYSTFSIRYGGENLAFKEVRVQELDRIFGVCLEYYKTIPALSIALAQTGDFIGGIEGAFSHSLRRRKCMNSFFCSVERPFKFVTKLNDDVSTYVLLGSRGGLFLTIVPLSLQQSQTQVASGGLTDIYRASGTYVKSFYSVMVSPSSVKIGMMGGKGGVEARIHHQVSWPQAVPQIIREKYRKTDPSPF